MACDNATQLYYSHNADSLADEYSKASPGYVEVFTGLLTGSGSILDVGCGCGRDIAELQEAGFDVTGADPSEDMLREAERIYPGLKGRLIHSALPKLEGIEGSFDGILCSGVLQHLEEPDLQAGLVRIDSLLKPGGIVLLSFPLTYPSITPDTRRDRDGRLFIIRPAEYYRQAFPADGYSLEAEEVHEDSMGRQTVSWGFQVFRKRKG